MITTGREFDTYEEAVEGFNKAKAAYEIGYGFYPIKVGDNIQVHPSDPYIGHTNGVFYFTYMRGESCD